MPRMRYLPCLTLMLAVGSLFLVSCGGEDPASPGGGGTAGNDSTLVAASCALADVQAAVDAAEVGDTVVIPTGRCAWEGVLTVEKGIHLKGVAQGEVTIVHDAGASTLIEVTEDPTHITEISNLRLVEGRSTADAHLAVYPGGRPVLLHDSYFETNGGMLRSIRWVSSKGVIWNNEFYSNRIDDQAIVFVDDSNILSWNTGSTMGAEDTTGESNVYVEDNLFREIPLQALDPDSNSRVVIRHNLFDNSAMASHGADTSEYGTRHWEIYDNTFTFTDHGDCDGSQTLGLVWFLYLRGGTGIIADNVMPDMNSCAWGDKAEIIMTVQNIRRDSGPYPCWTEYPAPHQVGQGHDDSGIVTEPVYIWGNTGGGNYDAPGLSDYEPDECGNGETVTDYIQEGRDYILGPKPGYEKYPYPHPLRAQSSEASMVTAR